MKEVTLNDVNNLLDSFISNETTLVDVLFENGLLSIEDVRYDESLVSDGQDDEDFDDEYYEYWSISSYLYRRLYEIGEHVINKFGKTWWCRRCTGQSILLDIDVMSNLLGISNADYELLLEKRVDSIQVD